MRSASNNPSQTSFDHAIFLHADYSKMMEMKDDYGNYIFESIRITLVCGMQDVLNPYRVTSLTRAARVRR